MAEPKPIGYWLKHLHDLLETHFEQTLGDLGVDRRTWQLLNVLSRAPRTRDELTEALAPFWSAGEPVMDDVLAGLAVRDWVAESGGVVTLTETGRTVHSGLAERVEATRAAVLRGLTWDQYAETVRILSVMAGNVEAALVR